jgi:hypothetical protein
MGLCTRCANLDLISPPQACGPSCQGRKRGRQRQYSCWPRSSTPRRCNTAAEAAGKTSGPLPAAAAATTATAAASAASAAIYNTCSSSSSSSNGNSSNSGSSYSCRGSDRNSGTTSSSSSRSNRNSCSNGSGFGYALNPMLSQPLGASQPAQLTWPICHATESMGAVRLPRLWRRPPLWLRAGHSPAATLTTLRQPTPAPSLCKT